MASPRGIGRFCAGTARAARFLGLVVLAALSLCAPASRCAVWGVKSHDPNSQPPVTLFHFAENGTGFTPVGVVRIASQQVDVDGIAMSPKADLYGFHVGASGGSTLVTISKVTAGASPVGAVLPGTDIRGAVFCRSGKLAALDAAGDQVVFVDPSTGRLIGAPLRLTLDGSPFDVTDSCDIAQRSDGLMLVCAGGPTVYALDTLTGALKKLFTDTVPTPDGYEVYFAGITFTRSASLADSLFALDVTMSDDVVSYISEAPFARTELFLNVIPSYNAGRGDLAAQLDPPDYSLGIMNRAAGEDAAKRGSYMQRFVVWGTVRSAGTDTFYLDDGSGLPVQVIAPGYSGISDNGFARAEGVLHYSADGPVMLCSPGDVTPIAQ